LGGGWGQGKKDRIGKPEETLHKNYGTLLSKSIKTNFPPQNVNNLSSLCAIIFIIFTAANFCI